MLGPSRVVRSENHGKLQPVAIMFSRHLNDTRRPMIILCVARLPFIGVCRDPYLLFMWEAGVRKWAERLMPNGSRGWAHSCYKGGSKVCRRGERIGPSEGGVSVPGPAKIRPSEMGHIGRGRWAALETASGPNDDTPCFL